MCSTRHSVERLPDVLHPCKSKPDFLRARFVANSRRFVPYAYQLWYFVPGIYYGAVVFAEQHRVSCTWRIYAYPPAAAKGETGKSG